MHKSRRFGIPGIDRTHGLKHELDPEYGTCDAATDKSCPVCFLGLLVVQFHHDANEVPGCVDGEDLDDGCNISNSNPHSYPNDH